MKQDLSKNIMLMFGFCAIALVGGCLPDSDSVREKKLSEFLKTEAASYASALSSYSVQSQNTLSQNAAFLNNTLAQGLIGSSPDGAMSYGYCADSSGGTTNHMMLTWYNISDSSGNFSVKGLGKSAGAGIVQSLGNLSLPETIGYFDGTQIKLRGPRNNGSTLYVLPSGCGLLIPDGAPVILTENLQAPETDISSSQTYEFRTVACEDPNDIGMITERRAVYIESDNSVTRSAWEAYDTTCNGAVSTRAIAVTRTSADLTGALDIIGTGNLEAALNGLAALDCVQAVSSESQTDESGEEIESGSTMADTCSADGITVIDYEGPGDTTLGGVEGSETITVSVAPGYTGILAESHPYNNMTYGGQGGPLNLYGGWSGTATYIRYIYDADSSTGDSDSGHGDSSQTGRWQGQSINAIRNERLTIACNAVFPEYNNASVYAPLTASGMVATRQNQINSWETASPPVPGDPIYGPGQGWALQMGSSSCSWDEIRTFNSCPSGYTLVQAGENRRTITATGWGTVSVGAWRSITPLRCELVESETEACSSGGGGYSGSGGSWDSPTGGP